MTEETLKRLNEIDKELEAIDKEEKEKEEIDMDFNKTLKDLENMEFALPGTGRFSLRNMIENNILTKKEEETNMNNLIYKYTRMNKEQEEIFRMYRDLVRKGATFNDIFEDAFRIFGKDGFVEIAKVIAMGYVSGIHFYNRLDLTDNELEMLVMIHLGLDIDKEDEKELDSVLYAICATSSIVNEGGNR